MALMDLSMSLKEIRKLNIEVLKKAKDFYERCFEVSGGCDHSVGICECADRMDYERLCSMIEVLEGRMVI